MLDQLKEIIERYADVNPDDIRGDTKLVEELGLTSFAVMGMMGDIEEEFDIAVDEEAITLIKSDYRMNYSGYQKRGAHQKKTGKTQKNHRRGGYSK